MTISAVHLTISFDSNTKGRPEMKRIGASCALLLGLSCSSAFALDDMSVDAAIGGGLGGALGGLVGSELGGRTGAVIGAGVGGAAGAAIATDDADDGYRGSRRHRHHDDDGRYYRSRHHKHHGHDHDDD